MKGHPDLGYVPDKVIDDYRFAPSLLLAAVSQLDRQERAEGWPRYRPPRVLDIARPSHPPLPPNH